MAFDDVCPFTELWVVSKSSLIAFVCDLQQVGLSGVAQRQRARIRHSPRHVRHAVVQYAIHFKDGTIMGSRSAGFEASALVNGDVNQDASFLEVLEHVSGNDRRGSSSFDEHGTNNDLVSGEVLRK